MKEEIIIYHFVNKDGSEQEFATFSLDLAFYRARRYGLKVIERKYEYKAGRVLTGYYDGLVGRNFRD